MKNKKGDGKMKKQYSNVQFEICLFESADVITFSVVNAASENQIPEYTLKWSWDM